MEARLSEVQKTLRWVLLASLALAFVVRPELDNGRYRAVLDELETFRQSFVRQDAEAALRAQAQSQGQLSLEELAAAVHAKRGPKLKLADAARPAPAIATVRLATLAQIQAFGQTEAAVTIGVPDPAALGASLAWRLARAQRSGSLTLVAVTLVGADVSPDEADLDRGIGDLRQKSLAARAALEEATRRLGNAERRLEKRTKRRSRSLDKMQAQLEKARTLLDEKTRAHAEAQSRYEAAAQAAERTRKPIALDAVPEAAVARVQLEHGREALSYDIPVRLARRSVPVSTLAGAQLGALHASDLWQEVRTLDPNAASSVLRSHFNWHMRTIEVLGIGLSGAKLLQLAPCIVPVLLGLLLLQMRRAETFYSPFSTQVPSAVPRLGFKHRPLELVVLVLLPLLAPLGASIALGIIHQLPILPIVSGVSCLALGSHAFTKLQDLRDQTISIVRAHSYPPPAADLSSINWG